MKGVEAQFKKIVVAKAKGAGEQTLGTQPAKSFWRQIIRQRESITHVTFALSKHRHVDDQYNRLAIAGFDALHLTTR